MTKSTQTKTVNITQAEARRMRTAIVILASTLRQILDTDAIHRGGRPMLPEDVQKARRRMDDMVNAFTGEPDSEG